VAVRRRVRARMEHFMSEEANTLAEGSMIRLVGCCAKPLPSQQPRDPRLELRRQCRSDQGGLCRTGETRGKGIFGNTPLLA